MKDFKKRARELDFENTVLGKRLLKYKDKPNVIEKMNDYVMFEQDIRLWNSLGKPNPFIDDEISIALFMTANLQE